MTFPEPIYFEPLLMEKVWGGSRLQTLFGKHLLPGTRIGESWEVVDREEAQSVVHSGNLKGTTLHELWTQQRVPVFGEAYAAHPSPRFPLLFKLLDAQERLSIQVHPPAEIAGELGGEPKTEMWYIVDTQLDEALWVGLKEGVTREEFEGRLHRGTVEEAVQRIPVKAGDAIFIYSGRVHAIGAGNVIVEVQQNSDTTYRVFDWNRAGLDGKPRELHIDESLKSIDFADTNPKLAVPNGEELTSCEYFTVEKWTLDSPRPAFTDGKFAIFTVLTGAVSNMGTVFQPGDFFLVPATVSDATLWPTQSDTTLLRTTIPA
ncbi:MAG TPA: type I phosphomannose isomerase catalytic subunit [Chthoniobacterales bacterium]